MKPLLVVDGYNILGAWALPPKRNWTVDEAREALIARLEAYAAFHGVEVVLVFDATGSDRMTRSHDTTGNVEIVFTRHGETADQYIERLCDGQPRHRELRVATNDGTIQWVVLGRGAARVTASELLTQMHQAHLAQQAHWEKRPVKPNPLIGRLPQAQQELLERMRRGK